MLDEIAKAAGGKIEEVGALPDGSGFATMALPLPKDHWLTAEGHNVPPMPLRVGLHSSRLVEWSRQEFADAIRAAGRYAVRCATMNGKESDFDPDALIQNLVVGLLGYWTEDGLSSDAWENPPAPPDTKATTQGNRSTNEE